MKTRSWRTCCPVLQADKHHTTGKPTALLEKLVEVAPPKGVVLDPFLGSGTTALAALRRDRRCIGIEVERSYFDIAVERLKQECSREALFA